MQGRVTILRKSRRPSAATSARKTMAKSFIIPPKDGKCTGIIEVQTASKSCEEDALTVDARVHFFYQQKIPSCVSTGIPKTISNQFCLVSALNTRIGMIWTKIFPVRADTARETAHAFGIL